MSRTAVCKAALLLCSIYCTIPSTTVLTDAGSIVGALVLGRIQVLH